MEDSIAELEGEEVEVVERHRRAREEGDRHESGSSETLPEFGDVIHRDQDPALPRRYQVKSVVLGTSRLVFAS